MNVFWVAQVSGRSRTLSMRVVSLRISKDREHEALCIRCSRMQSMPGQTTTTDIRSNSSESMSITRLPSGLFGCVRSNRLVVTKHSHCYGHRLKGSLHRLYSCYGQG